MRKTRRKGKPPGLVSAPLVGALRSTALAVGALEAAVEHARTHLALILALEQRTAPALVAPALPCLVGRTVKDHAVALDPVDIGAAQRMIRVAAFRIGLGKDDPVTSDPVDGSDMLIVRTDDLHMLTDLAEQLPLQLPALAPAAEVAFELHLMLAAIIVIVAVELAQVPVAHGAIVRV